jgi:acyl-CoA thioesterase-1
MRSLRTALTRTLLGMVLSSTLAVSVLAGCARPFLAAADAPRPLTYVAIGASDTVGVGATSPETDSWPAVLWRRLPQGSQFVNLGVSGSLLHQALEQQLPVAIDMNPDLVTVWLSVNDYTGQVNLDQYEADLDTLLGQLRAQTSAVILVGNLPDLSVLPIASRLDLRGIDRWNAVIQAVAARHQVTLVDLQGTWQDMAEHPDYISSDGFHPSTSGYRRLAEVFYDAAAQQLAVTASAAQ